jgi:CBS domain-containing membrane protein
MLTELLVKNVMTAQPVCVYHLETLERIRYLFSTNSIHHIPVLSKENTIIGIISFSDLNLCMDWTTKFDVADRKGAHDQLLHSLTAIDVCTKEVFTVRATDTLETCYRLFSHNQFHCLPVIDEDGKVVGIITTYDMLKVAYDPNK